MSKLIYLLKIKALLATFLLAPTAYAAWEVNLPVGVTSQSQAIFDLHMLTFWVCVAIAVIVYGVMGYSLIAYRRRSSKDQPAKFAHNLFLEWTWTIGAALILVVLAVPATKTLIDIYDTSPGEINIKVVGYQWKWGYEYLEEGFSLISNTSTPQDEIAGRVPKGEFYLLEVDKPIYVPINTTIRFLITARDVLHAFWLPELGIKQDAIPGYFNAAKAYISEPGVYRGVCAELCGLNHGFMPIVLVAVEQAEYQQWVAERKKEFMQREEAAGRSWQKDELLARGQQVYLQQCSVCHQANGAGIAGAFPTLVGSPIVLNQREAQINTVLRGVQGTAMQSFAQLLSPADLAAVLTYTRASWGNAEQVQGDLVIQPVEILNLMEGN